jgi:hypothetical protein
VEPAEVEPVDVLGDRDLEAIDVLPRPVVAHELGFAQVLNASAIALS